MLEDDRRRAGWSVGQVAWRFGVSVPEYQAIEAGDRSPNFETWAGSANCWRGRRGSLAEGVEMPDWAFIVVPVALRPIDSADCEAHSSLIVDLRTQGGPMGSVHSRICCGSEARRSWGPQGRRGPRAHPQRRPQGVVGGGRNGQPRGVPSQGEVEGKFVQNSSPQAGPSRP